MPPYDFKIVSRESRPTVLQALEAKEHRLESLALGSMSNTEPTKDKIHIPRELIAEWAESDVDPFPDIHGLKKYAQQHKELWKKLQQKILDKDVARIIAPYPEPIVSELELEGQLKVHFNIVNLALETVRSIGRHLMIGGGRCATKGDAEADISSEPDKASFLAPTKVDPKSGVLIYCFEDLNHENATKVQNIIPGEVKLWYKFRRSFLDAGDQASELKPKDRNRMRTEAEKVFTQVYQYMNERNAAIGYIITDSELICVRRIRKERYGIRYGVIDISPSIPVSVEEGQLNAKLALFYIHVKYGILEHHKSVMLETPKPSTWRQLVNEIRAARLRNSVPTHDLDLRGRRIRREFLDLDDKMECMYEDDE